MLISRKRLLALCLVVSLAAPACDRLPVLSRTTPTPTATEMPAPTPAWQQPDTYRLAMLPAWADDVIAVSDPPFYYIRARLFLGASQPRLQVQQTTRYTNRSTQTLDRVYFRLFANKPSFGSELAFGSVTVAGQEAALDYQSERTAVGIILPTALRAGEAVDVEMLYNVTVPVENARGYGTYNYQDGILLLSNFYAMVAVHEADGWNLALAPDYGDPVYAETSFYSVEFTAPTDLKLVASGSGISRVENSDGTVTWKFVSGPMRDWMLVASERFESVSLALGHVRVNSYFLPQHRDAGVAMLAFARDSLRAYQESFGPYPFAEFDVVEAPVSGGMEYPGLILIDTRQYEAAGEYLEFITAHEVAHQWWYSLVGNDQVTVPWLDEGLTNFSTLYYYEYVYGSDRARLAFDNYVASRYVRLRESGQDAVVNQPVEAFSPEMYSAIVYGKAALFFQDVRAELGDTVFLDAMRAYLVDRKYQLSTPEDWLRVFEQVSGQELDELYTQWILEE